MFVRWLVDNGSDFSKLTLKVGPPPSCPPSLTCAALQKYAEEMRGVHAVNEIKADDVITSIPLKCLITVEMGQNTEVRLN